MPFHFFTEDDWSRPHGYEEPAAEVTKRWNKVCMHWELTLNGHVIGILCPDHEAARADPAWAPVYAAIETMVNNGRPNLKVVK